MAGAQLAAGAKWWVVQPPGGDWAADPRGPQQWLEALAAADPQPGGGRRHPPPAGLRWCLQRPGEVVLLPAHWSETQTWDPSACVGHLNPAPVCRLGLQAPRHAQHRRERGGRRPVQRAVWPSAAAAEDGLRSKWQRPSTSAPAASLPAGWPLLVALTERSVLVGACLLARPHRCRPPQRSWPRTQRTRGCGRHLVRC